MAVTASDTVVVCAEVDSDAGVDARFERITGGSGDSIYQAIVYASFPPANTTGMDAGSNDWAVRVYVD